MKLKIETKTFVQTDSKGRETTWIWDETPEFREAIKVYRNTVLQHQLKQNGN